ncbi:MAG: twin-arginine translocase TatA/TatE family subunit [bacterium]|nr:twin-arginine translocase TatA/TatE family subunit [bacterium]
MFGLGTPELIVIAVVILLLFGGKKLPELMRGLGGGVKEFKQAMRDAPPPTNDTSTVAKSDPQSQPLNPNGKQS